MTLFVSLLRGINVGGQKKIRMDSLREIYAELGFTQVRTYVQSGNVVFASPEQDQASLVKRIEARIHQVYGYHVSVFLRQAHELRVILVNNPFIIARHEDLNKLHVTFLYQEPSDLTWDGLTSPKDIPDEFARTSQAIYLFCPNGYGKSKLSNTFFERKLGMPVSTRNWNTVNALYKMMTGN